MYWRLRKMLFEYFRRRRPVDNYVKSVDKVVAYRYLYFIVAWTALAAAGAQMMFVRKDPNTGDVIFINPSDIKLWDLGAEQPFDVHVLSWRRLFEKATATPVLDDDDY